MLLGDSNIDEDPYNPCSVSGKIDLVQDFPPHGPECLHTAGYMLLWPTELATFRSQRGKARKGGSSRISQPPFDRNAVRICGLNRLVGIMQACIASTSWVNIGNSKDMVWSCTVVLPERLT